MVLKKLAEPVDLEWCWRYVVAFLKRHCYFVEWMLAGADAGLVGSWGLCGWVIRTAHRREGKSMRGGCSLLGCDKKQFLNWFLIPVGVLHAPFSLKVYCLGFPWFGRVLTPCSAMDHSCVSIMLHSLLGYQSKSALNSLSYLYTWSNGNLLDRLLRMLEYCNNCMHLLGYFMQ